SAPLLACTHPPARRALCPCSRTAFLVREKERSPADCRSPALRSTRALSPLRAAHRLLARDLRTAELAELYAPCDLPAGCRPHPQPHPNAPGCSSAILPRSTGVLGLSSGTPASAPLFRWDPPATSRSRGLPHN